MKIYVPNYYEKFHCIGSECKDNCCIGWEIDIDENTLDKYKNLDGKISERLKTNITVSEDGSYCFKLDGERCPFLNEKNLCELIIYGGEDMLCDICHLHPRFKTWLPDRIEMGIGLCCEEAARIILTEAAPFSLIENGENSDAESQCDDELTSLFAQREKLFAIIEESDNITELINTLFPQDPDIDFISSLEPINDEWKNICEKLKAAVFDYNVTNEAVAYKNLITYYIFRYYQNGEGALNQALSGFCAKAVRLIQKSCKISITDAARIWSKEIEYSEENMDAVYDYLYQTQFLRKL